MPKLEAEAAYQPPPAPESPVERPLVASGSRSRSALERFDAGAFDGSAVDRSYLRRLEPVAERRRFPPYLLPLLGAAVIVIGAVLLIRYRIRDDDLATGGLVSPTVDQMAQATVQIQGLGADGKALCSGSGTIVSSSGLILTNAHVVTRDAACNFSRVGVAVTTDADRPPELLYEADLLVIDTKLDLAVVKVARSLDPSRPLPTSFLALALGDSDTLNIGDSLRILGYPEIGGETITFTNGSVGGFTAQAGIGDRALIKTDATIAGGNSGGAAVDAKGNLIGIPTKARASENGPAVDCRPLADTNGDNKVDTADNCVTIGGFLNGLRPVNLARSVIEQARNADPQVLAAPNLGVPVDPGSVMMSRPRFSLGEKDNTPVGIVSTADTSSHELCLFVDWSGIPAGAPWDAIWFVDKKPVDQYSLVNQSWTFGDQGANFWVCAIDQTKGLPGGLYELGFFVSGQLIFAEGMEVTPKPVPVRKTTWLNETGAQVCTLAINPKGSGPTGLNELVPGEPIPAGGKVTLELPDGHYVVEARDCQNEPVADSGGEDGGVTVSADATTFSIKVPPN
jgi:S1-C subfamily serine protease